MKRFYKFLMPLVAIVALALPMQAQDVSMYTLATGVDATKWVTLSASATEVTSIYDDDEASSVMNIGFTFTFAGSSYTQWSCNSNGRIALGSTAVDNWWVNPFTPSYITDSRTVFPLIAALGMDNTMEGTGVWCKYEVVGEAPSRMLVIEYRTPSVYDADGDLVNYQIQLEEGTNVVRFVYGATTATTYDDFQAGMASSVDDVITVSPSHVSLTGPTETVHSSWPGENRYYEFTPPTTFCSRVASVSVSALGPDFITLSWVDNNNSSWIICWVSYYSSFTSNWFFKSFVEELCILLSVNIFSKAFGYSIVFWERAPIILSSSCPVRALISSIVPSKCCWQSIFCSKFLNQIRLSVVINKTPTS